jgi:transcriptional regulator with XRE-family HTH domain
MAAEPDLEPVPVDPDVVAGRAVAAIRDENRHTQTDLARLLAEETGRPWSRNMVAKMEAGGKRIGPRELRALSKIYGLPTSVFVYGPSAVIRTPNGAMPRQRNRAGQRRYPQSRDVPLVAAVPS